MNLADTHSYRWHSFDFMNLAPALKTKISGYNIQQILINKLLNFMLRGLSLILVFMMSSVLAVNAQCNHSLSLKRATIGQDKNSGIVEVVIKTSDSFVCTIFSESGAGLEKISSQSGKGTKDISFQGLTSDKLYLVQVEFNNEQNKLCRKLQKSQITLERQ